MFLEPHFKRSGWIEVICGSMFSGKTEELLRRLRRVKHVERMRCLRQSKCLLAAECGESQPSLLGAFLQSTSLVEI